MGLPALAGFLLKEGGECHFSVNSPSSDLSGARPGRFTACSPRYVFTSTHKTHPLGPNQFRSVPGPGACARSGARAPGRRSCALCRRSPRAYQQSAPLFRSRCLFSLENETLGSSSHRWEMSGTVTSPSVVGNWKAERTYANTFFWNFFICPQHSHRASYVSKLSPIYHLVVKIINVSGPNIGTITII